VEKLDQRTAAATSAASRLASARDALAVAEADRKSIEAQKQELEIRLARTEIKAPRAGIISRRTARVGQIASMAADPLFRIIADGLVELEAEIADVRLPRVAVGQKVLVTPAGYSDALEGKIRLVSPEVDKASRLGRIRIAITSPGPLSVGASAKGIIELGRKRGPTVPQSAVAFSKDGATVQVVVDGVVKIRPVTLGLTGTTSFQVVDGLRDGEMVVVRAGSFLRDGDRVTPVVEGNKP
jgi:HlyD family secretion protein